MTEPEKPNAWTVYKGWHAREDFWFDVYKRLVSALLTVLVVFLFAVASGYLDFHKRTGRVLLTVAGLVLLYALIMVITMRRQEKTFGVRQWDWSIAILMLACVGVIGATVLQVVWGI
jgi:Ca2+/H+ antiporter